MFVQLPSDTARAAALTPGEFVVRAQDTLAQGGVIESVRMTLDLQEVRRGKKVSQAAHPPLRVLCNVPGSVPKRMRAVEVDDCIVYGRWVGRVTGVHDRLQLPWHTPGTGGESHFEVLDFSDGTMEPLRRATLTGPRDPEYVHSDAPFDSHRPLADLSRPARSLHSVPPECLFFPGQPVRVRTDQLGVVPPPGAAHARRRADVDMVVRDVLPGMAYVRWLACVANSADGPVSQLLDLDNLPQDMPEEMLPSDQLTPLTAFHASMWQLGDHVLVPPHDALRLLQQQEQQTQAGAGALQAERRATSPAGDLVARVVGTHTFARVRWQDGTVSDDVASTELVPLLNVDNTDFWPEDVVVSAASGDEEEVRTGLVVSVNAAARTAAVHWLTFSEELGMWMLPAEDSWVEDLPTETVAVYDLEHAGGWDYHVGMSVALLDVDSVDAAVWDAKPFVGQVIAKRLGRLTITWCNGVTGRHSPEEVMPVGVDEGAEEEGGYSDNDEEEWEEDELENADAADTARFWLSGPGAEAQAAADARADAADEAMQDDNDEQPAAHDAAAPVAPPPAPAAPPPRAHVTLAAMAASLPPPKPRPAAGVVQSLFSSWTRGGREQTQAAAPGAPAAVVAPVTEPAAEEEVPAAAPVAPPNPGDPPPRFDTVTGEVEDHHFAELDASAGEPTRQWSRAVSKEWALLQRELPPGVWVRAYEDRTDLLRCVISGAEETPYAGHAFVFDVRLGPSFPEEAPEVHYISHGLRANPNLYTCGKVCLSLLGTWQGKDDKGEAWTPGKSTLLQVFLSIQALVLTSEPYFNEPGWSGLQGSDEGTRNSAMYNEQVRIVCLRSCLALLRAPPAHVGDILWAHYAEHGMAILAGCEADLAEGAEPSDGYKASLAKLLPKLRDTLGPVTADTAAQK